MTTNLLAPRTASVNYAPTSGELTFAAGQTSQSITVAVLGDRLPEPMEQFFVRLSAPTHAIIADGVSVGMIIDDNRAGVMSGSRRRMLLEPGYSNSWPANTSHF